MTISYDTGSPADQWRCNLYFLVARPFGLIMLLVMGLVFGACFGVGHYVAKNFMLFAVFMLGGVGVVALVQVVTMWFMVMNRTRTGSRPCSTTLLPEGMVGITPDGRTLNPWSEFSAIRMDKGDIYFYRGAGGQFIPRTAFVQPADGIRFFEAAVAAKKGDFSLINDADALKQMAQPAQNPAVWPPAPAVISNVVGGTDAQQQWRQSEDEIKQEKLKKRLLNLRVILFVPLIAGAVLNGIPHPGYAGDALVYDIVTVVVFIIGNVGLWVYEKSLK